MLRSLLPTLLLVAATALARDLYVDPTAGDEKADGISGPVKTIARGLKLAQAGDTVHLAPVVFKESAVFFNREGAPDQPIVLDGHGATLEGSEPLDPAAWTEETPGLFRCDDLLRHDDAVIQRWFFLWDGRMNHMGRTSKGHRDPLKKPEDLQPGEWTYVKAAEQPPPEKHAQAGSFYIKLPPGQKLADAKITAPMRSAGVQLSGINRWLVIRNVTATHVYNDGYNIHGHCDHVRFENIRAIECGDDGISAHETAEYHVRGLVSIGNSTGICDTGSARTSYEQVYVRGCLGADLMFLDGGQYSLRDALVESSAQRTLAVSGRADTSVSLTMENVFLGRVGDVFNEARISANATFTARRCTFERVNVHTSNATAELTHCAVYGYPNAQVIIGPETRWTANDNFYALQSLTFGNAAYPVEKFAGYQKLSGQDLETVWRPYDGKAFIPAGVGADATALRKLFPEADRTRR